MASRITPTLSAPTSEATTDRRQDILNAALACAVDGGVDAVSIDGVRARCGASVGSIYHHFGNKDGIVAALFFDIFHDQSRSVQAQLDAATARCAELEHFGELLAETEAVFADKIIEAADELRSLDPVSWPPVLERLQADAWNLVINPAPAGAINEEA